jgi:ATP synthase protein I
MLTGIHTGTRRVALAQAGLAPVAALVAGSFAGIEAGLGVLYGVLVALALSTVLVWRERQSMRHPEWDQHRLVKLFMRTGVERLGLLVGLFFVGFAVLKLAPLPLLIGLVVAQFAWLAAATGRDNKEKIKNMT